MVVVGADVDAAEVDPVWILGVAHLHVHAGQFFQRALAGGLVEPGVGTQTGFKLLADVAHHGGNVTPGLVTEIGVDVQARQRVEQLVGNVRHHSLFAGLGAHQLVALALVFLGHARPGLPQEAGTGGQREPAQQGLHICLGEGCQELVQRLDALDVLHLQPVNVFEAQLAQHLVQVDGGDQRLGLRHRHDVVGLGRVAGIQRAQPLGAQLGFHGQDGFGVCSRLFGTGARMLQHAGDVAHVQVADALAGGIGVLVLLQLSASGHQHQHAAGVLAGIHNGPDDQQRGSPAHHLAGADACQVGRCGGRCSSGQGGFQWLQAQLVQAARVHGRAVVVAHLLLGAALGRTGGAGVKGQAKQLMLQRGLDHGKTANVDFRIGNSQTVEPVACGIGIKVHPRADRAVHVSG